MNSNALTLLLHLAPGDPEPLREQIARQLRDRIVRGELAAGDLLPGHRQVARQYRVAPSTVEAAYELLAADGLLTDGLPEAREAAGEPLGYQALESILSEEPSTGSPSSWLSGLFDRVQQRTGRVPEDDWTAAMLVPRDAGEIP
jgi:DNA-binding transcriptional MocR family regulator